ncbi:hypothetical protein F4820DRAFT_418497 [Hypoxylon rubiginosum]|uniref:Uncharacterized protein n=1 Tax=Hypoxylon rubiginosum TaxID=110542 RepID=A0ACB9Z3T9_9PEZI|nr:hypothetical protein F4820DRAFT_418497 [Hypoxylon rubiginosum]
MLMPSALSCDSSHPPVTRLQSALFASPPASPPTSAHSSTFGNIFNSCRALQSMLTTPATIPSNDSLPAPRDPLPTPPMAHTALPPLKLRLRSRKADANGEAIPRKKVVKRPAAPPRGINKRRRAVEDDVGRDDDIDSDLEIGSADNQDQSQDADESSFRPSTPKRARIAPEVIPLGLERNDFHNLHTSNGEEESTVEGTEVEIEADGEKWSKEDDRILVELVLEKLKLSKTDWQDCARSLGKDRSSIGRRWRSLMINGDVGLKSSRSRRGKIHSTWR